MSVSSELERRTLGEVRVDLSEDRRIRGYAIVFNSRSVDLGGFIEIISPDAVNRTINQALDVHALWNHDTGKVLGRTPRTLTLRKDSRGLRVEIDSPKWAEREGILETIERGDVTGMSFAFRTIEDDWRHEDGFPIREVLDMVVSEVSVVAKPAYPQTDVAVAKRALEQFQAMQPGRSIDWLRKWHRTRLA
jgi:Escherichia/Staphylococcus phage prohead protease